MVSKKGGKKVGRDTGRGKSLPVNEALRWKKTSVGNSVKPSRRSDKGADRTHSTGPRKKDE